MDWSSAMQTGEAMLANSKIKFVWQGAYAGVEDQDIADSTARGSNEFSRGTKIL